MITKQTQLHNDEIDLKQVFKTISKYKISIVFITLIFFIASIIFAYYQPNIYSSKTTIQINKESKGANQEDLLLKALGEDGANIEDEIQIIKSRLVVQKALETLPLGVRYYKYNTVNKKTEFYKDSPFEVRAEFLDENVYGKKFDILPISKDKFRLILKPISKYSLSGILKISHIISYSKSDKIIYNKVHSYDENISNEYFNITIKKTQDLENNKKYQFKFVYYDDLYDEFIGKLSISTASKQASILVANYQDNIALRAKDILNAISKSYITLNIKEKSEVAELTLGFINEQLKIINKNLNNYASILEDYRVKNNIVSLQVQGQSSNDKLEVYKNRLFEVQTEINILTNLFLYIHMKQDILGLTINTGSFTDKTIASLILNLKELVNKKKLLLINFTEEYPEVKKYNLQIKDATKSIKLVINNNIKQLMKRKSEFKKLIKKYNNNLNLIPTQETKLATLTRPLNINQNIYEFLLKKKAETSILKSSTISSSKVIDKARVADKPIKPKRKLIVIVGLILGLIVGISIAFFREFLINTIQSEKDVESLTSIPIYGSVPNKTNKLSRHMFDESLRAIRTNLQFLPADSKNQIISITSTISGEGKTTISAALAKIIVGESNKVIVLDIDLRKSSIHKEFNVKNNIGITNYITKQNTLDEVIKDTGVKNLDIITTGNLPPNPSELILSNAFTELLDELRTKYDYIIMDTPPAGIVTDAVILMNYSDISFYIVRNNYTKKEFVKDIDKISKEHSNNKVGIILNGVEVGKEYGYGSYAYNYTAGKKA